MPFSTIFACTGELSVDTSLIPEGALLDPVCRVGAYPAGSIELAVAVGSASGRSNVLVLEKHGVVTVGGSLQEALNRMEYLELICRIIISAKGAGVEFGGRVGFRDIGKRAESGKVIRVYNISKK